MASNQTFHMADDIARLCRQSTAIHPDWTAAEHLAWLEDEGIDPEDRIRFSGALTRHAETVRETVNFWIDRGGLR